jgi:hypothetical protein
MWVGLGQIAVALVIACVTTAYVVVVARQVREQWRAARGVPARSVAA